MNHLIITGTKGATPSPDGSEILFILDDSSGAGVTLHVPISLAGVMRNAFESACRHIEATARQTASAPQGVIVQKFDALPSPGEPKDVLILIQGTDLSQYVLHLKTADSRRLAALLTAAAGKADGSNRRSISQPFRLPLAGLNGRFTVEQCQCDFCAGLLCASKGRRHQISISLIVEFANRLASGHPSSITIFARFESSNHVTSYRAHPDFCLEFHFNPFRLRRGTCQPLRLPLPGFFRGDAVIQAISWAMMRAISALGPEGVPGGM